MFGHPTKHRLLKLRKLQKTIKLLGRSAPVTHIHTVCIDIARTETPAIVIRSQMCIGRSECAECAEQHIKRRCWLLAAGRCRTDALRRLCQRSQRHVKVLMFLSQALRRGTCMQPYEKKGSENRHARLLKYTYVQSYKIKVEENAL